MLRPSWSLSVLLGLSACRDAAPPAAAVESYVLTTLYPLTYFAQRIAGDAVDIGCPLPPGADPIFWQPGRHEIASLQGATLILTNGAAFERWIDKTSLPMSRVVDTSKAFAERYVKFQTTTHSHGAGGQHTHEGIDGHTWLDPLNAKLQSQAIHDALAKAFPQHVARFAAGLAALQQDLDALHLEFEKVTALLGSAKLLASHPAYNYLAARYGWSITNLDLDPEGEPSAAAVQSVDKARGAGKTILLWEAEPHAKARAAFAVESVVFSPCEALAPERIAAGEDYVSVMRGNLARLSSALGK